jgi:DNA gyrase subunit B
MNAKLPQGARGTDDLVVLEGLAVIRARPDLFLGKNASGRLAVLVNHILQWVFGNDGWGGHASSATVTLTEDNGLRIADNGRGLPVLEDDHGRIPLTYAFTSMMTGAISANGLSVVTALSNRVIVEVRTGGRAWMQEFENDVAASPIVPLGSAHQSGTTITFWPRWEFFPDWDNDDSFAKNLSRYSSHNPGLDLTFVDERSDRRPTKAAP